MRPKLIGPILYNVWISMFSRCYDEKHHSFMNYGGRGIKVCKRWHDYSKFISDMGERPPNTSLDRIDNNKGYSPKNCRWATRKEQQRNRRITRKATFGGKEYLIVELAEQAGKKYDTILERIQRGLPFNEIISKEDGRRKQGYAIGSTGMGGRANGARQRARTHCAKGHEYTFENTRITPEGWRACRKCHLAKVKRQYAARRAALAT